MFLFFEVMDKEPSLAVIWGIYMFLAVTGFFLARINPLFLIIILPLVFLFALMNLSEINDQFVGPAIIREAGYSYVIQNYIAIIIGIVLPLAGIAAWFFRKTKKPLL